jgi:predicted amidohydrolase
MDYPDFAVRSISKGGLMQDTRIAVVTMNAQVADPAGNLERVAGWVQDAAAQHAKIICFPELNLSGYHLGETAIHTAQTVPGPASDFIKGLADNFNITILAGLMEIDDHHRVYATHLAVRPGDTVSGGPKSDHAVNAYRKTHLGPPERDLFTPGDRIPVFEGPGIRYGIQLCYDAHFPELSTRMALGGAHAIFFPHASPHGTPKQKMISWMRHLPARAFDNGLFVIACNLCGTNGLGRSFPGVVLLIGPSGNLIASYTGVDEHMLIADLSAAELNAVRGHPMRYFLPHRRTDLYNAMPDITSG